MFCISHLHVARIYRIFFIALSVVVHSFILILFGSLADIKWIDGISKIYRIDRFSYIVIEETKNYFVRLKK